ncbi:MAG: arylamine N-acetyltransferase [Lysobacterales bacterium]
MTLTDITNEYLRVLELERRQPDLAFLTDLTSRHVANFSFSSVGPLLGNDLPLDIESLYQRIVVRRRGGYCFEQNGLLQAVLEELGFNVTLYLGRVIYNQDNHPGLTHRITLVETGGKQYVADVGFGPMGPRCPVSLSGEISQESFRVFRIAQGRPGEFHMQTLKDGAFYSLYRFELARYGQSDCEVGHFYSHKHPGATFVNHLVVSSILADEVRSLRNHEFWLITASGEQRHALEDGAHLREVLDTRFGVKVDEKEGRRLFERIATPAKARAAVTPAQ